MNSVFRSKNGYSTVYLGNCLEVLRQLSSNSVHCCVTSPPYWGLRDYDNSGQLGLEETPEDYVNSMIMVFHQVKRILRDDGTLWLNLGDSYSRGNRGTVPSQNFESSSDKMGNHEIIKTKDLVGIPWRVAFALQQNGWYLRQDIIWHKNNSMPESVTDRCTKSHEYVFLLSKSEQYYFDNEAIKEQAVGRSSGNVQRKQRPSANKLKIGAQAGSIPWNGSTTRNRRSVWTISVKPYKGAHFATFPCELAEIPIKAATSEMGCCPKCGSPWRREIKSKDVARHEEGHDVHCSQSHTGQTPNVVGGFEQQSTIGWKPSCECGEQSTVPCTVLEPFAGSGTTLAVANKLGRSAIGVEINQDYIPLIIQRLDGEIAFENDNVPVA